MRFRWGAWSASIVLLLVTACSAPARRPPDETGVSRPRHDRPPARDDRPPARDPFTASEAPPPPPGIECTVDADCTLQTYPDPDKDGCCPHWCGRPVISVAGAKEAEKRYRERCRPGGCPPHDCAGFRESEPRCVAERCVAKTAEPRPPGE